MVGKGVLPLWGVWLYVQWCCPCSSRSWKRETSQSLPAACAAQTVVCGSFSVQPRTAFEPVYTIYPTRLQAAEGESSCFDGAASFLSLLFSPQGLKPFSSCCLWLTIPARTSVSPLGRQPASLQAYRERDSPLQATLWSLWCRRSHQS